MAGYRDLLQQVKSEIDEIDAQHAAELRESAAPVFVDVRDRNEWDEGHIPGAVHVPRGNLESRIENAVPDRDAQVVVYCASGARSAFESPSRSVECTICRWRFESSTTSSSTIPSVPTPAAAR